MDDIKSMTLGIPPAQTGALAKVQQNPVKASSSELMDACLTLNTYQRPTEDQAERHQIVGAAAAEFLYKITTAVPPGPERSTAISRLREARAWANAAIALEGK